MVVLTEDKNATEQQLIYLGPGKLLDKDRLGRIQWAYKTNPPEKLEVQNEATGFYRSMAFSQFIPCLSAGYAELKLGSIE